MPADAGSQRLTQETHAEQACDRGMETLLRRRLANGASRQKSPAREKRRRALPKQCNRARSGEPPRWAMPVSGQISKRAPASRCHNWADPERRRTIVFFCSGSTVCAYSILARAGAQHNGHAGARSCCASSRQRSGRTMYADICWAHMSRPRVSGCLSSRSQVGWHFQRASPAAGWAALPKRARRVERNPEIAPSSSASATR